MKHRPFNLARLRDGLRPFRLHWFTRLSSTNDHAARLRRRGELFAPAVVLTASQTAGRGRGGNTWWSSRGCLTVTFVLPVEDHLAAHQLPLVAGLAVRNAVAELLGESEVQLKWPNDIVYSDRKLAGLLCERMYKADLIGLGLNINVDPARAPTSLRGALTSMSTIAGQDFDPTDVLLGVARHLRDTLSRRNDHPFATLLKEYHQHHALVGRRIRVTALSPGDSGVISGRCTGLDSLGRLLVRNGSRTQKVLTGHVQMV